MPDSQDRLVQDDGAPDLASPSMQQPGQLPAGGQGDERNRDERNRDEGHGDEGHRDEGRGDEGRGDEQGGAGAAEDDPDAGPADDPVWAYFLGKTGFVFYRDFADLLIQHFDLSYRGDDAAARDQLAALLLLDTRDDRYGGTTLMDAVLGWFASWHQAVEEDRAAQQRAMADNRSQDDKNPDDEEAADEAAWAAGSLNPQQMATIACVIYGSNPTGARRLLEDGLLPESQAADCAAGFSTLRQRWARSLAEAHIAVGSLAATAQAADQQSGRSDDQSPPVTLHYDEPADPALTEIADWIRKVALFDGLVRHVNEDIKLPAPIGVSLAACGTAMGASAEEASPAVDVAGGNLRLCYELLDGIYDEASTQNVEAPPE